MIFLLLLIMMFSVIELILGILPNAPATPAAVISGGDWMINTIGGVIAVLNYVFSPALMVAIMVVVTAMFTWEYIYSATMWLVRKLPMLHIN